MSLRRRDTADTRAFWDFVAKTSREVRADPHYHWGCQTGVRGQATPCNFSQSGRTCAQVMADARRDRTTDPIADPGQRQIDLD